MNDSTEIENERYAAAWRKLRSLKVVSAVFFILTLSSFGWAADGNVVIRSLQVAIVTLTIILNLWLSFFRCPRCRHRFLTRQSWDRCQYCGLPQGSTREEAKIAGRIKPKA